MLRYLTRAVAAVALLTSLSACYLTNEVVIPPEKAETVPGLEGNWKAADGSDGDSEIVTIAKKPGSNDYAMTSSAPDAQGQALTLRGFKLTDTVYAAQMWDDAAVEEGAVVVFVTVDDSGVAAVLPTGDPNGYASEAGITLASDGQAVIAEGDPAGVLKFIELHQTAEFTPPTPVMVQAD